MNKKSLIAAALIAAGIISQASADEVVYLTGSTAFRSTVFAALSDSTATGVFDVGTVTQVAGRGPGSGNGATYMVFHGNIATVPTYINCSWNGSDAGLGSVLNITVDNDGGPLFGAPAHWLKMDGTVTGDTGVNATAGELETIGAHQGDIAFSDTSIAAGISQVALANAATPLKSYGAVGVVAFTWVKNNNSASGASAAKSAWDRLVNITTLQENNLFPVGALPADYFTGTNVDNSTYVYLVGRNKGSGTRANAVLNAQVSVDATITQFTIGGGIGFNPDGTPSSPSGALLLDYALDASGITADDGYESGGSVAKALGVAGSSSQADPINGGAGWIAVGYLGVGDATKNGLTTANWLTENGVAESNGTIQNGTYSYWGYENIYGKNGIVTDSTQDKVGNRLVSSFAARLATAPGGHDGGISLGSMNASKATDFSFPSHN